MAGFPPPNLTAPPPQLSPQQQAQYAALASHLAQSGLQANPNAAINAAGPSLTPPPTPPVPQITSPTQPNTVTPSQTQFQQIQNAYPGMPNIQADVANQESIQQPQYHQPNKWLEIGTALLGGLLGGPAGYGLTQFAEGLNKGADQRYARDYQQYQERQTQADKKLATDVTLNDAQAKVAEKTAADESLQQDRLVRQQQNAKRLAQGDIKIGISQQNLQRMYWYEANSLNLKLYGINTTAHDSQMATNARFAGTLIEQAGADRRNAANVEVKNADAAERAAKADLDASLKQIANDPALVADPDKQATAASAAIQQYDNVVHGLLENATPSGPLGGVSHAYGVLTNGLKQDDQNDPNSPGYGIYNPNQAYGTAESATGTSGGSGSGTTVSPPPPGAGAGDPSDYKFLNQPVNQNGGKETTHETAAPPATPPAPEPVQLPPRSQEQHAAYVQQLEQLGAQHQVGGGTGVPPELFRAAKEGVAQHASDYPTAQAYLQSLIQQNPQGAAQLSKPQVAELLETWARTRAGQRLPVNIELPDAGGLGIRPAHQQTPSQEGWQGFGPARSDHAPAPAQATPTPQPQAGPSPIPTKGEVIIKAAMNHHVPPALLAALITHESGGDNSAVSPAGAIGIGQLMPGTAQGLGVNPHDPVENINGAAQYLESQLKKFGSIPNALAAYNAGPAAVIKYRGIPPYAETQKYVTRVIRSYQYLLRSGMLKVPGVTQPPSPGL